MTTAAQVRELLLAAVIVTTLLLTAQLPAVIVVLCTAAKQSGVLEYECCKLIVHVVAETIAQLPA